MEISSDEMRKLEDLFPVKFNGKKGTVEWLDQTRIPWEEVWKESGSVADFERAIKKLEVRGAPTIGVYAAYCIASLSFNASGRGSAYIGYIKKNAERIRAARPTAVNLSWAVGRMLERMRTANTEAGIESIREALLEEANKISEGEYESGKLIGVQGTGLIKDGDTVFTRCNTGMLGCAGSGTAYAVIRKAWEEGKNIHVIVPHTAPLYQGARITMWECERDGIPATLIADDMVGYAMENTKGRKVALVGADRILLSGDVANKIGTMQDAILAKHFRIPFYVAAPTSTIDPVSKSIRIEMRDPEEVKVLLGKLQVTTRAADALNPAFDVTPHSLVSAIITEKGVAREPYTAKLKAMKSASRTRS